MYSAIDAYNRVHDPFKIETCLMLVTNGWELLSKAVLLKSGQKIIDGNSGRTISAEVAVARLKSLGIIDEGQGACVQQVISLRNQAVHSVLPAIPEEILHHLLFFSCKFFKETLMKFFKAAGKEMGKNFLSLSFDNLTTYADKVQKLIGRFKKSKHDRQLVWLLERGVKFDGAQYIAQDKFEKEFLKKERVLPHLAVGKFLKEADMVRVVAVQAPRNYTADVILRKGTKLDPSLPVIFKKTELETDYPYLTSELAAKVGKSESWVAHTVKHLNFKKNAKYHQEIRAGKNSTVQRYSDAALQELKQFATANPNFNPFRAAQSKTN